jgi:hypothetical protein
MVYQKSISLWDDSLALEFYKSLKDMFVDPFVVYTSERLSATSWFMFLYNSLITEELKSLSHLPVSTVITTLSDRFSNWNTGCFFFSTMWFALWEEASRSYASWSTPRFSQRCVSALGLYLAKGIGFESVDWFNSESNNITVKYLLQYLMHKEVELKVESIPNKESVISILSGGISHGLLVCKGETDHCVHVHACFDTAQSSIVSRVMDPGRKQLFFDLDVWFNDNNNYELRFVDV